MAGLTTLVATKLGASKALAATIGKVTSTGLIAGGTALDVTGTLQAGKDTEAQADLEQSLSESQALAEEQRGVEEERLRRRAGDKTEARQRAQFAKGGVKVGEGSPLLLIAETALDTEEDIAAIFDTTKNKAKTFKLRGQTFRGIGKAARSTSKRRAGSSLLSGINDLTRSNP